MPGRVHVRLVAPIGAGVLLAALAATHVWAQSTRAPSGLRTTIDAQSEENRPGRPKQPKRPKTFDPSPIGQVPTFGVPAARGAGKTGFKSITAPKGKKGGSEAATRPGVTPSKPLSLSASESVMAPDKPAADGKKKQPPQAKRKERAKDAPKPATAPKAPALQARAQSREQLNTLPNTVVPVKRTRPPDVIVEEDPFEPLGVRAGAFVLRPALETIAGYDSNPGRVRDGRGSAFLVVAPELKARSDWLRHELSADIRGSQTWYKSTPELDRPYLDAKVNGRIDVTELTRADLEGRYRIYTDNPGSPNLQAGLAQLPLAHSVGGSAGVAHRFNRIELAAKGMADRTEYEASRLTDGTIVSNAGRNFDQYGGQFRASYELTPGVKPFGQIDVDTRRYDLVIDAGGERRNSDGIAGRAGTTFELSRILTGEFALGYLVRSYEDPTLEDLRGLIVDGSLVWKATGLTTATFLAKTSANETTLTGVSGVLTRDLGLQVDHAFRRWLIGTLKLGVGFDDYVGSIREDKRYVAGAALTYKLTRTWQVKGEFRQEWLKSNIPANDYTASIAMVGLRWQP